TTTPEFTLAEIGITNQQHTTEGDNVIFTITPDELPLAADFITSVRLTNNGNATYSSGTLLINPDLNNPTQPPTARVTTEITTLPNSNGGTVDIEIPFEVGDAVAAIILQITDDAIDSGGDNITATILTGSGGELSVPIVDNDPEMQIVATNPAPLPPDFDPSTDPFPPHPASAGSEVSLTVSVRGTPPVFDPTTGTLTTPPQPPVPVTHDHTIYLTYIDDDDVINGTPPESVTISAGETAATFLVPTKAETAGIFTVNIVTNTSLAHPATPYRVGAGPAGSQSVQVLIPPPPVPEIGIFVATGPPTITQVQSDALSRRENFASFNTLVVRTLDNSTLPSGIRVDFDVVQPDGVVLSRFAHRGRPIGEVADGTRLNIPAAGLRPQIGNPASNFDVADWTEARELRFRLPAGNSGAFVGFATGHAENDVDDPTRRLQFVLKESPGNYTIAP
ncbi:MAG: hypothetical protein MJE68_08780, partial [Proteobacteria bacterium]|nr:hypothetical protein [Pseudomonadota bacterium]